MENFWFFIILIASVAIFSLFKPRIKGIIGEKTIAIKLTGLNRSKYKVINNLVLNVSGRTSQIDHLVISNFGLFVIETKNLKGWILGGENSEYWTQVIYRRKEKFHNPIRQNRGHIMALKHYLPDFPKVNYIPIIVFSNSSTIKVQASSEIIYSAELLKVIRKYSDVMLSEKETQAIYERISSVNISAKYNRSIHINQLSRE